MQKASLLLFSIFTITFVLLNPILSVNSNINQFNQPIRDICNEPFIGNTVPAKVVLPEKVLDNNASVVFVEICTKTLIDGRYFDLELKYPSDSDWTAIQNKRLNFNSTYNGVIEWNYEGIFVLHCDTPAFRFRVNDGEWFPPKVSVWTCFDSSGNNSSNPPPETIILFGIIFITFIFVVIFIYTQKRPMKAKKASFQVTNQHISILHINPKIFQNSLNKHDHKRFHITINTNSIEFSRKDGRKISEEDTIFVKEVFDEYKDQ